MRTLLSFPLNKHTIKLASASYDDRYEMSKMAFLDTGLADEVSQIESSLTKPSYTSSTLKALQESVPDANFVLAIGMDQWQVFDQWHDYQYILNHCSILIFPRPFFQPSDIQHMSSQLPTKIEHLQMTPHAASSTILRSEIANRKIEHLDWLLPSVLKYINSKNLYTNVYKATQKDT
jgi:nicotinate-nucleotide adenylyltransferase